MYAYSMAAAHENLPHVQFEHFMISNTDSPGDITILVHLFRVSLFHLLVSADFLHSSPFVH